MGLFRLLLFFPGVNALLAPALTAQSTESFNDPRDGNTYQIVLIGDTWWFTENLRYRTTQSYCPNFSQKPSECSFGNFYFYQESERLCPDGWQIPTTNHWKQFVDELPRDIKRKTYNYKKQLRTDLKDFDVFQGKTLIQLAATGRVEGSLYIQGDFADFWTSHPKSKDPRFHMHITPSAITGHAHKHHLDDTAERTRMFSVRCVQSE